MTDTNDTIQKIADELVLLVQNSPTVDWRANVGAIGLRLRALSARASAGEGVPEITPALAGWFIAALGDIPDDYQRITTEQVMEALRANVEHFTAAPQPAQAGASGGGVPCPTCGAPTDRVERGAIESYGDTRHYEYTYRRTTPASPATGESVHKFGRMNTHICVRCGFDAFAAAPQPQALDTGNLASDPLYKALDALYSRGWTDLHKGRDHDPRGTNEWQAVLDMFRTLRATPPAHGDGEGDISGIARIFIAEHDKAKADCIPKIFAKGQRKERDVIVALRAVMEQLRPLVNADIAYSGDGLLAVVEENHPHQIICYWPVKAAEVLTTRPTPEEARDAARYRWLRNNSVGQWEHPIVVSQRRAGFDTMQYIGPLAGTSLDAAIDAALALPAQGEG